VAVFGQGASSEPQTLKALLSEVHELRKDLQASLGKIHGAQILLSRLEIQEVAVSRASQHLDDARSRLAEVQMVVKSETDEIKHLEEQTQSGDRAAQAQEALDRARPDLETSTALERQRQAIETDAEQQLRTEQDKLRKLESQLDEVVSAISNASEQSPPVQRQCERLVQYQHDSLLFGPSNRKLCDFSGSIDHLRQ